MIETTAQLADAIQRAQGGEVLRLAAGARIEPLTIRRREFVRPLTIIADGATLVGLMIYESRGVRLVGGCRPGRCVAAGWAGLAVGP